MDKKNNQSETSLKERYQHMNKIERFGARSMIASVVLGVAAIGLAVALIVVSEKFKNGNYTVSFVIPPDKQDSIVFEGAKTIEVAPGTLFGDVCKPNVYMNYYDLAGWVNNATGTMIDDSYQILGNIAVSPNFISSTIENSDAIYAYIEDRSEWGSLVSQTETDFYFITETSAPVSIAKSEFNYHISVGAKVSTIPDNFLAGCVKYNLPMVIPSSVHAIGNNFMKGCTNFDNTLIIPDNVSVIGDDFLSGCTKFNRPINFSWDLYAIGNNFMSGCTGFNSLINFPIESSTKGTFPASLFYIGDNFMSGCTIYTQTESGAPVKMSLPHGLTHLGAGFLHNCYNFSGIVGVDFVDPKDIDVVEREELSFSCDDKTAIAYINGIRVEGTYHLEWSKRFPNSPASAQRNFRNIQSFE